MFFYIPLKILIAILNFDFVLGFGKLSISFVEINF